MPFYPTKKPQIKILKNEKICWRYHHFANVYKNHNHRCMVLEIQKVTDRIFCYSGLLFVLLLLYGPRKSKLWKNKKKKKLEDIIIFQMCTINDSHMMYGSWDMKRDRHRIVCHFLSFLHFFTPLLGGNNPKNQNFEKLKKIP